MCQFQVPVPVGVSVGRLVNQVLAERGARIERTKGVFNERQLGAAGRIIRATSVREIAVRAGDSDIVRLRGGRSLHGGDYTARP